MIIRKCLTCGKEFKVKLCEIKRGGGKFCSRKCFGKAIKQGKYPKTGFQKGSKINTGRRFLKVHREKLRKAKEGKILSEKHRKKISKSHKGNKSHFWKGGITLKNKIIRESIEFSLWREVVFARDNWTCQKYGTKGGKLHPHHIQNFADYPELRFAIDNGITFSKKAHQEFHKRYGKKNNTKGQLEEFLTK